MLDQVDADGKCNATAFPVWMKVKTFTKTLKRYKNGEFASWQCLPLRLFFCLLFHLGETPTVCNQGLSWDEYVSGKNK